MENLVDKIRRDCWDKALDSFGFSYIYSRKTQKLDLYIKWIRVLGFIIPVLLGAIVSSYYAKKEIIETAMFFATPLAIAQLVLSAMVTSLGSETKLSGYITKSIEYGLLNSEFQQLANFPDNNFETLSKKYDILVERERGLSKGNNELTDKEKRRGMRAGLRNYKRACVGCGETPLSIVSTKCEVCGNF